MRPTVTDRDQVPCPDADSPPSLPPGDGADLAALWLDLGGGD